MYTFNCLLKATATASLLENAELGEYVIRGTDAEWSDALNSGKASHFHHHSPGCYYLRIYYYILSNNAQKTTNQVQNSKFKIYGPHLFNT